MLIMDAARDRAAHRGGPFPCLTSHLISTKGGTEGRRELLWGASRLGLRARWLQKRGSAKEHFDLIGERVISDARKVAREVGTDEFRAVLGEKLRLCRAGEIEFDTAHLLL